VANVQKAAADNGVLVASLQSMPRVLTVDPSELQESTKRVTVFESVRRIVRNTDVDATISGDTSTSTKALEAIEIVGIILCAVAIVVLLGQFFRVKYARQRNNPKQPSTPSGSSMEPSPRAV
jgi:hypothetical protein